MVQLLEPRSCIEGSQSEETMNVLIKYRWTLSRTCTIQTRQRVDNITNKFWGCTHTKTLMVEFVVQTVDGYLA